MEIIIRKAKKTDSEAMALLFMMVMDNMVYRFIGQRDIQKGFNFFIRFIRQEHNQYSYENCYVAILQNEVIGVINVYDGSLLEELRRPILNYIHQHNTPEFTIEDETQAGEFYIDVIAVKSNYQGNGIGSQLLAHIIAIFGKKAKGTLGLLVDKLNPNAKKLYLNIGFRHVGAKTLSGHEMEHLQLKM